MLPERGPLTDEDAELLAHAAALPDAMRPKLLRQAYGESLDEAWKVIRAANAYIDRQAPWALRKTDQVRMAAVLRVLVDVLRPVAHRAATVHARQHGQDAGATRHPRRRTATLPPWPPPWRRTSAFRRTQGIFPRYVAEPA